MFYLLIVLAVFIIVAEIFAATRNRTVMREGNAPSKWQRVYRWRWFIGIPFAVASAFIIYPMAGENVNYMVLGFPLFVAAFDESGRDYVGVFTAPFFLLNSITWYFLPQLILYVWAKVENKRGEQA